MNEGCPRGHDECNSGCVMYAPSQVFDNAYTHELEWDEGCRYFVPAARLSEVLTMHQNVKRIIDMDSGINRTTYKKLAADMVQLKSSYAYLEKRYYKLQKLISELTNPRFEGVQL